MMVMIHMVKLVLFGLILMISMIGHSQSFTNSSIKEYLSMTGEVHTLALFIDTQYDSWEDEEIDYYYDQFEKSQDWLIDQAEDWNQSLTFENDYFISDNKSILYLKDVPRRKNVNYLINTLMEELGYNDFDDFIDSNNFDFENEKLKCILFVKSNNRSHAYNYWSVKKLDLAIIYCKSTYGMLTDQYVMAHEMLHQFGAWDLYYERGKVQTKESSTLAMENYPHSVMINTKKNKEMLAVDEVTAWRIGWSEFEDAFTVFDPKKNKEKIEQERKESKGNAIKFTLPTTTVKEEK